MANTIRAAKNTFLGGLVMDLAPDTTPNEVLTSALNATLVTFNGNEMLLQNDMGNGRVETARLPEGYIPVGTCEFGDIIYIVSYNPLTNKSLIGCFPSPERNISSEEVGSTGLTLSSADFLVMSGTSPTGELKTNSVKKVIYNNKLNPGDKFIIYDKNNNIHLQSHITDLSNPSHVYGSYPKWLRIHVIAIEDGGKINYLDSSLRWYDVTKPGINYNYFINEVIDTETGKVDIDSYRNKLSSGYSIFQSKVSGKLALLIELEKITGFSCTHTIYSKPGDTIQLENGSYDTTNYLTYINFSWETDDPNINPAAVILTSAKWIGKINQLAETEEDMDLSGKVQVWVKDGNNIKKGSPISDFNVYKKFENNTWEPATAYPNEGYYEASINLLSSANYANFINEDSYLKQLLSTLNAIIDSQTNYGNDVLSKLNIRKSPSDGYLNVPTNSYYINAIGKDSENHILSKSSVSGKLFDINPVIIPDYIVNNYFHYPVYKRFLEFTMPTNQKVLIQSNTELNTESNTELNIYKEVTPDLSNMIFEYEITPAMPYGLLREYSIKNYIDFSKIGTGAIDFNTWKYFVGENVMTLTLGLETYVEDNMGISEIAIIFYDNQGPAAVYHILGKASYSGQFSEVIPLNGATNKHQLNATNGNETYIHCGPQITEYLDGCLKLGDNDEPTLASPLDTDVNLYLNDAGIIYQGMLYLAKIIVKYCPKDSLDNLDDTDTTRFKVFNRWLWTTTMYNDFYYLVRDFNDLSFNLSLDIGPKYEVTSNYFWDKFKYVSPENSVVRDSTLMYKYLSSQVQIVTDRAEVDMDAINNNDLGGGTGGGGNSDMPVIWSNWRLDKQDSTLTLTMGCTIAATWDPTKLTLQSSSGTTYIRGTHYRVVTGDTEVLVILSSTIPAGESMILTSLEGFGTAEQSGNTYSSGSKILNFKYEINE